MGDVEPKPTEEVSEETETPKTGEEEKPESEGGEPKPDDTEAKPEGDGTEAKGGEPEEPPADGGEPAEAEEKRKRAGGWQRKIEKLQRQNELLIEQLAAQRTGPPPPASKPDAEKTAEEKAAEYIDGLVEKRFSERERQREHEATVARFQQRCAEARTRHPDFDDMVASVAIHPDSPLAHAVL